MDENLKFALVTASLFSTPSLIAWLILRRVVNRSASWSPRKRRYWRVFWTSYLALQTSVAGLFFLNGMQSTGEENAPAWGVGALIVWTMALTYAPGLSAIIAAVAALALRSAKQPVSP